MNTESKEVPKWAMSLIEGLTAVNTALAERVRGLSDRLDALEGKEPEKEPEKDKSIDPKDPVFGKVMEQLFI